jgi:hypothetical protein
LEISLALVNQLIGSLHTVVLVYRCRPSGTPTIGEPDPAMNGHMPHTWTDVPRHSGAIST